MADIVVFSSYFSALILVSAFLTTPKQIPTKTDHPDQLKLFFLHKKQKNLFQNLLPILLDEVSLNPCQEQAFQWLQYFLSQGLQVPTIALLSVSPCTFTKMRIFSLTTIAFVKSKMMVKIDENTLK